jgi:hypothetical protein
MSMTTLVRCSILVGSALVVVGFEVRARGQEQCAAVPYIERHAVFRPAFDIPSRKPLMETGYEFPTKPLFLKGYAGYNYGRGPREAFIPTGYGTGTIQPVGVADPVAPGAAFPRPWWRLAR